MFSIHDRVSWVEKYYYHHVDDGFYPPILCKGKIVAEEENDHYLVKRDSDGKCEKLCYRKLRKI